MKETTETLLKHTRNELVEMAEKLGINTASMAKTTIAQSILEARKKAAKETPKPKLGPKYKAEAAKVEALSPVKIGPKVSIGNRGVLAKRAAIDMQIKENTVAAEMMSASVTELQNEAKELCSSMDLKVKEMLQEGATNLQKGVREMQKGIGMHIKETEKASAKMGRGIKEMQTGVKEIQKGIQEIQSAIDKKTADLQSGVEEMHGGVREIQNSIKEMGNTFREFQNETGNYIKDFYYG